jgi:hypothetical protein
MTDEHPMRPLHDLARRHGGWDGTKDDPVNRPKHYVNHPSGIECIQITEHMNFNIGNVIKYCWRAGDKNGIEDLKKAQWYLNREIARLEKTKPERLERIDT